MRKSRLLVPFFFLLTGCYWYPSPPVIIEWPRDGVPRVQREDPLRHLPPQWEERIVAGRIEERKGRTIRIPTHRQLVYRKGDGSRYVPRYQVEVLVEERITLDDRGFIRRLPADREQEVFGGYWECNNIPTCRRENPPPPELFEREPRLAPEREPSLYPQRPR